MERIVDKYLRYLKDSLAQRKLDITWDQKVVVHLSALNKDVAMGARDIHRKIKEHVLSKLTASRIEGKILQTDVKVHIKVVNGQLEVVVIDKGKVDAISKHELKMIKEGASKEKEAIFLKMEWFIWISLMRDL